MKIKVIDTYLLHHDQANGRLDDNGLLRYDRHIKIVSMTNTMWFYWPLIEYQNYDRSYEI